MATITETNGDASATPAESRYSISLGDTFQGTLGPDDDSDLVAVQLGADTIIDISLTAPDTIKLSLLNADGDPILTGAPNADGAKIIFEPASGGTYYIRAQGEAADDAGDYAIALTENTIPVGTYDEMAAYLAEGYRDGRRASFDVQPGGVLTFNITELPGELQHLGAWALAAWTHVTGIRFEPVAGDDADITFHYREGSVSSGGFSALNGIIVDAVVNLATGDTTISDSYTTYTLMHEIGHALGLGHPGPYPADPDNPSADFGIDNVFLIDSLQTTLMSYMGQHENTYLNASLATPATPMIADILAIQDLYGTPQDANAGDTIYGYDSNLDGYLGQVFSWWAGDGRHPFTHMDGTSFSHPALADLDGDGDLDLILGNNHLNSDGTDYDAYTVNYYENTGTDKAPSYLQRTGDDNPLNGVESFVNFKLVPADLDGDGDLDLLIGNLYYYENTGTATAPAFEQRTGEDNPLHAHRSEYYKRVVLPDMDGDGDLDMVAVQDNGAMLYFENTGTATAPAFEQRTGEDNPLEKVIADENERITPAFTDLDNDGDPDLSVGRMDGSLDYYENTGSSTSPAFTERTGPDNPYNHAGQLRQANPVLADIDNDGDLDLVAGDIWGKVYLFENTGTAASPEFTRRNVANEVALTLYDSSGTDTLDLRNDNHDQRVDLRPEGISDVYGLRGNLVIARDTLIENYVAGAGDDVITGNAADNVIEGRAGGDAIDGGAGSDTAAYTGSAVAVTVNLLAGTVSGGHAEGDTLTSIENLTGSAHDDTLTGDGDDNVLEGGAGADTLKGGGGTDTASYVNSDAAVTAELPDGLVFADDTTDDTDDNDRYLDVKTATGGHAEGDALTSDIENLIGSRYNDVLIGNSEHNRLDGGPGNDRLAGGIGADVLVGGPGLDTADYSNAGPFGVTVNLGDGSTTGLYAEGDTFDSIENLTGSAHDDTLTGDAGNNVLEGGPGADTLDGGEGIDTASYEHSPSRVDVRLSGTVVNHGDATGDTLANIENLIGSAHNDTLAGNGQANWLTGLGGNDLLWGSGGDDLLTGGPGADRLIGGAGNDTASFAGSPEAVTVRLHSFATAGGHAHGDSFPYTVDVAYTDADGVEQTEALPDVENLIGSAHGDILAGDRRDNVLDGGPGDDTLYGGPGGGNDVMSGGTGSDRLFGGQGADTLKGGPGDDSLAGGPGADVFVFGPGDGTDTVTDFSSGTDKVDLSGFEIESIDNVTMTIGDDGVALDLADIGGGSILLAGLTSNPDAGDFAV